MTDSSQQRHYRLKARALSQEATRRRIVEATMELHEEIGPRATTISAIAARAGVQRLTVYRHFEDERAVFEACTSHWLELNPPPDPAEWRGIADPDARRATALAAFFDYYGRTRAMWTTAHRDVADVPALQGPMQAFSDHVAAIAADLGSDLGPLGRVTVAHLLRFPTWASLDAAGLGTREMVELARGWISGACGVEAGDRNR